MFIAPFFFKNSTVRDHAQCFTLHSDINWRYISYEKFGSLTPGQIEDAQKYFDYVAVHYSVRPAMGNTNDSMCSFLRNTDAVKIFFLQDDYQKTGMTREWIAEHHFHLIVTVVPEQYMNIVYPQSMFPDTKIVSVLTGYIPLAFENGDAGERLPYEKRDFDCVYRGQGLPFELGDLCQEKRFLAVSAAKLFPKYGLEIDVDYRSSARKAGGDWFEFIESGRWSLASESGANIFDIDGSLQALVAEMVQKNPDIKYEAVRKHLPAEGNIGVYMNQVSPRIFETVCLRTGLAMFPGDYSGVLEPDEHYLVLEKDFSNVKEICKMMKDKSIYEKITNSAFDAIHSNSHNHYKHMVQKIEETLYTIKPSRPNRRPRPYSNIGSTIPELMSAEIENVYKYWSDNATAGHEAAQHYSTVVNELKTAIDDLGLRNAVSFVIAQRKSGKPFAAKRAKPQSLGTQSPPEKETTESQAAIETVNEGVKDAGSSPIAEQQPKPQTSDTQAPSEKETVSSQVAIETVSEGVKDADSLPTTELQADLWTLETAIQSEVEAVTAQFGDETVIERLRNSVFLKRVLPGSVRSFCGRIIRKYGLR